jgi:hypothetical protein
MIAPDFFVAHLTFDIPACIPFHPAMLTKLRNSKQCARRTSVVIF